MTPMNRRHFLMSTAVMAGGAAVHGLQSPNETVRIAVVGCGGRGSSHVSAWPGQPNVEIVALCDVDEAQIAEKLKTLESKGLKKPAVYSDFRKLLEDKSIDAVSLATPNHWHTLQTIWACQAGKDVYVEKPLSHNVFESQQIVAAARKYNRMVQQGSQSRSSPALREARPAARRGRVRRGLHVPRALLQVARQHRQISGRLHGPGREVRATPSARRRTSRPTTPPTCRR